MHVPGFQTTLRELTRRNVPTLKRCPPFAGRVSQVWPLDDLDGYVERLAALPAYVCHQLLPVFTAALNAHADEIDPVAFMDHLSTESAEPGLAFVQRVVVVRHLKAFFAAQYRLAYERAGMGAMEAESQDEEC